LLSPVDFVEAVSVVVIVAIGTDDDTITLSLLTLVLVMDSLDASACTGRPSVQTQKKRKKTANELIQCNVHGNECDIHVINTAVANVPPSARDHIIDSLPLPLLLLL
jgi:hypothetical protein